MAYESKRAVITKELEYLLKPQVEAHGWEYYDLVTSLARKHKTSERIIEDIISLFIKNGVFKEKRLITVASEDLITKKLSIAALKNGRILKVDKKRSEQKSLDVMEKTLNAIPQTKPKDRDPGNINEVHN